MKGLIRPRVSVAGSELPLNQSDRAGGIDSGGGVLVAESKAACTIVVIVEDPDRGAVRGGPNRCSGGKVNC